jgi:hypothetical protein
VTDSIIRKATNSGRPFGSESFIDMLLDNMKEKNKATGGVRKVMGNLRFPLDKTYHGCP